MNKSVKGSLTEANLLKSFAGESQAKNRYTFFSEVAKKEGYEASIDELADGITFAIIQDADGSLTVQKIEQGDISLQANQRVAGKFHCGLTYHKNASTAHIHWTATSSQLTAVRARVYCKPTYIIGGDYGKYFFYGDIDEYRDLGGRYNTANGATDDFDIDSGLKKVNIGWTSASITTVRGGTLALPSSIDTVELN